MRLLVVAAVLVLLLLLVSAAIWVLWSQVGLWTIPIVFVLLIAAIFGIKKAVGSLVKKLFMAPFKMKGAVLQGATAEIHEAVRLSAEGERQLVRVDATITPAGNPNTPFRAWEIGELRLVPHTSKPGPPPDDEEEGFDVERVEVWHNGAFVEDGSRPEDSEDSDTGGEADSAETPEAESPEDDAVGGKVGGGQRIRLTARVPPHLNRARFRYYFEVFGDVAIR